LKKKVVDGVLPPSHTRGKISPKRKDHTMGKFSPIAKIDYVQFIIIIFFKKLFEFKKIGNFTQRESYHNGGKFHPTRKLIMFSFIYCPPFWRSSPRLRGVSVLVGTLPNVRNLFSYSILNRWGIKSKVSFPKI